MPHNPTKKQRMEAEVADGDDFVASFDDLADVLPNILGFLSSEDIMGSRCINKKTMEAVKMTVFCW